MKTILPKGSVAITCMPAPTGGPSISQDTLHMPASKIVVIPSNIRSVSQYKIDKNVSSGSSSPFPTLPSAFPMDLNCSQKMFERGVIASNAETLCNMSKMQNDNLKEKLSKINSKKRKSHKSVLNKKSLAHRKVKPIICESIEMNISPPVHRSGTNVFINDSPKEVESTNNFLHLSNSNLEENIHSPESSTQKFTLMPGPNKVHCSAVPYIVADAFDESTSRKNQQNVGNSDLITQGSNQMGIPRLRANSPPSYEAHVSSVPPCESETAEDMHICSTEYSNNIYVPPPYNDSSQDRNSHLYMSSNYNTWSSPMDRTMDSSTLIYDTSILHEPLQYNTVDSREPYFASGDPSSNLDNYFYAPQLNPRSSNPNSSRYFGPLSDSSGWQFENCIEDEPRDYSNSNNVGSSSTHEKQLLENINSIEEFIENAESQMILNEKKEQSYEERRRLAINVLNNNDCESKRKQVLRENFWIIEDEPLHHSETIGKDTPQPLPSSTSEPPLLKPRTPKEFICHICGKMLKGRSSLRSHIHLHLNIKPYSCPYCSRKFTQSSILKNHIRTHTGETPYGCEKCGKAFKTSSILQKHLSKHSNVRAFKCCVCSKCYKTMTDLRNHLKIHTSGPHSCGLCKKLYDSRSALSSHIQRKHQKQNRYYCPKCNKSYSLKCLLKQHMNVHSNEQKHYCHVCGASYVWKSGLAAHLRTHSFRIQCEICGEKFLSLKKLERHRSRHAEPFPHKCPKCDRQFRLPYLLKNHLAKHTDELVCTECGIGFITKTKLRKHLKIHNQSTGSS